MSGKTIPKDYLNGLKENYKSDAISGFLVFLIALPLCLGISKASGFPPIAGIYTAIIGGIFVSLISGSILTIKGPAAGLIVIALGAITELGNGDIILGYKLTLAVVVISGGLQILFGVLKSGVLSDFFPSAVIHGMMAAIGIIIFSKQIHFAIGVVPQGKEALELIEEIPHSLLNINPEVAMIGAISLAILFIKPLFKNPIIRLIPAPLIVLSIAIPLGLYFDLSNEHDYGLGNLHFHINPAQLLVALPDSFLSGITFPDFSQVFSWVSIKYIVMFSLVGSIESLLSSKAIDTIDPYKRKSDFDKDLIAIGLGNMLAGFIGGLPMISEIVRSSTNINNGGQTRWANFFHGFFLLGFVVLAAPVIQKIPNAALAAMLMYTGYNLAAPKEFVHMYKVGFEQLVIFMATVIITLMSDLLIGVFCGILLEMMINFLNGSTFKSLLAIKVDVAEKENHYTLKVRDSATFTNFIPFKKVLDEIPKNSHLTLDFSVSPLVDHTFISGVSRIEDDFYDNGGKMDYKGFDSHHFFSKHPLTARKRINNPNITMVGDELTTRQSLLQLFSAKANYEFDPKRTSSILKFSFGQFPLIRKLKYGENTIVGTTGNYQFFFADISIEESTELSLKGTYYMATVLFVSNIAGVSIPNFVLSKEKFFDKIKELQGTVDIDFDEYPEFSSYYFLTGDDETEVREFFSPDLIQLFVNEKSYSIEERNNVLMIHMGLKILNVKEIKSTLTFVDQFINLAGKEKKLV